MIENRYIINVLLLLLSIVMAEEGIAEQLSPNEVAWHVYHRDVGRDMQMVGSMELISARGQKRQREYMSLRLDHEDGRKVLIRFTEPADIAGTSFLVLETDGSQNTEQHLYLPALKRTRRIVTSQQRRSFVNSDFTYEDMQRQPLKNWTYQLDVPSEYLGRCCYVLISEPRPSTNTQYSRTVSLIDVETFTPLKIDFYDDKNRYSKRYQVGKLALIDGIVTEMEVTMEDLLSAHTTNLVTKQVRYNSNLPDTLFTIRNLEQ